MTNSEILKTPDELLTEIQRQEKFLLRVAAQPMPCPVCHGAVNQFVAAGLSVDEFQPGYSSRHTFRCPSCQVELIAVVPFFGPPYLWRVKHPDQVRDVLLAARQQKPSEQEASNP